MVELRNKRTTPRAVTETIVALDQEKNIGITSTNKFTHTIAFQRLDFVASIGFLAC